jgi:hypothetical protein
MTLLLCPTMNLGPNLDFLSVIRALDYRLRLLLLTSDTGAPCFSMWDPGTSPVMARVPPSPPLLIDNLLPHGRSTIKHKFSCGRDFGGDGVGGREEDTLQPTLK